MKFIAHLLFGIMIFILFYFIIHPELSMLIPSAFALLLGSVVPDLDHPFSHIRKAFRTLSFILIFAFVMLVLTTQTASTFIQGQCLAMGCQDSILLVQIIASIVISFFAVLLLDFIIPFHRGPLHGVIAAVGYSVLCGLVSMNYTQSYFVIAAAGLLGYLTHIIPDMLFKE